MNVSIRTLLTGPLLVLTILPAAIVGGLFYSNSQSALKQTVTDLLNQISARTQNQLQLYLSTPHFINQLNASAFEQNLLPLADLDTEGLETLERYFNAQFRAARQTGQSFEHEQSLDDNEFVGSINHVYVGTETGILRGAEYRVAEDLIATSRSSIDSATGIGTFEQLDDTGTLLDQPVPYNVLERPWYQKGKELWPRQDAGWSIPYCDQSTKRPAITAVRAVALDGTFLGVLGSDFLFDDIQQFLEDLLANLNVKEGHILVLDNKQDSLMISAAKWPGSQKSSNSESDARHAGQGAESKPQCDPDSDTMELGIPNATVAQLLEGINAAPDRSDASSQLKKLTINKNERYFWNSVLVEASYGLKLSIVIAIPEDNFTAQIKASTRRTVWLCLITLLISGGLGIGLAQWMIKPVLTLEATTRKLPQAIHGDYALLPPAIQNPSELQSLAQTFGNMSSQLQNLFYAFGHFVPQKFLTVLGYEDATQVKLGSYKTLDMTILFADIRSFTQMSESMTPEENFQFINDYLSMMEPAISEHHGFIDKYIGDAIMALFDGDRSLDNAVQAGLNMLRRLNNYNQTHMGMDDIPESTANRFPLKIGIGIHAGMITLGTLGGRNRWDTTVIGREVNLASRLEGLTKEFGIGLLISGTTLAQLTNVYDSRYLGEVTVRGVDQMIKVHELYGADPEPLRTGKVLTHARFQAALEHYERERYLKALITFKTVLVDCADDSVAQFYIRQCAKKLGRDSETLMSYSFVPIP
ncbi:MAG: adenylate/guanylate cyclase domain-containing protein [Cyanobacteria bacterium P01_F01_bin.150]